MLDPIKVPLTEGGQSPINRLANISVHDAQCLVLTPYDSSVSSDQLLHTI